MGREWMPAGRTAFRYGIALLWNLHN